jgi:hypothetical protein
VANVVPIPKSGTSSEASNYRPIFLLSVVSKVLVKHITTFIVGHLEKHCPLSNIQWGFRPHRSTGTALILTLHKWFSTLDNRDETLTIFL